MSENEIDEWGAVEAALPRLRIFPLPSSVLIPGGHLPLHVFEPRYRRMIADVLAGDRVLGVALLAPGWESAYQGRPEVLPCIGVGYVQADERLPDGRYNILVHGVARARIVEELDSGKPYRIVRAEAIRGVDAPEERAAAVAAGRSLRQLVIDLAGVLPDNVASPLADACVREADPGRLADLVGAAVLVDHRIRQEFLEEPRIRRRLEIVSETVAQLLLEVSRGSGGGWMM
ncbi:MAG TPA: LON peptidase substrate-binding domain-containing protein [Vulgatibacter sp.]